MVQAMINITEHANRVLNIIKAKYGLKDKSEAIDLVVNGYEESILEPELRPEYIKKLQKIEKVINSFDVEHYKNLRYDMKDRKRAHIGHFVLVFKFIKQENKIIFVDFDHYDNIYS